MTIPRVIACATFLLALARCCNAETPATTTRSGFKIHSWAVGDDVRSRNPGKDATTTTRYLVAYNLETTSTNSAPAFSDSEVIETWGWLVARQENIAGIEISTNELAALGKGFAAGTHGQSAPFDLWKASPDLERLAKARRAKLVRAVEQQNETAAREFFRTLKMQTNVLTLPGGVCIETTRTGNGHRPKPRQAVTVRYTARLPDGTEFAQFGPAEELMLTNHAPFSAWVNAMQKLDVGGAAIIYVPPPLPEGEAERWGIPPGSTRVFSVELTGIRDATEQELADALVPPAPDSELPASGYTEAQVFETWGWTIAQRTRAMQFGLSETQLAALTRGVKSGVSGQPGRADLETITPVVEDFVNHRREQAYLAAKQKRDAETTALFAQLKANTNVITLPSGLCYEILKPGSGAFPKADQFVSVNYTGRLIEGRIFDQTDPTLGPLDIKVGSVIAGWNEGIQKIGKGGKIKLYIPPTLGYGDVATGGIPPNSTLIFEIELLDIRDTLEDAK